MATLQKKIIKTESWRLADVDDLLDYFTENLFLTKASPTKK